MHLSPCHLVSVRVRSNDEIGQLVRAFNAMARDLGESEKKIKDMAELLPQIVYEVDIQGTITFVNQYALELFGYTQQDIEKGMNILEVVAPADHARLMVNTEKTLAGEKIENIEYTALKKNKSTFPFLAFAVPMKRDDKIVGMRGLCIDITQSKRAEEALRESEGRYRSVVDNVGIGIALISPNMMVS